MMLKRNAKHTATVSLGIMGAGFLATFPVAGLPVGVVLQSGFEAGLAGGLADWFAITALFRHPLRIPIPHTALLPKNRERVTNALVNAIQSDLLNKESIIGKMESARIAEMLLTRARLELDGELAGQQAAAIFRTLLSNVSAETVAGFIMPVLRDSIRKLDAGSLLKQAGAAVLERKYEASALDYVLLQSERLIATEQLRVRAGQLAASSLDKMQMGGIMGFAVNAFVGFMNEEKLGGMIQEFLLSLLADLRSPDHPMRRTLLDSLRETVRKLSEDPGMLQEMSIWQERIAASAVLANEIERLAARQLEVWSGRLGDPEYCRHTVIPAVQRLIDKAAEHREWLERADRWIQEQAAALVERNHGAIGKLVKENADKLDNDTLIAMMENHIGKDLQWIRVNGALCGFAIGLVLGGVQLLANSL